MTFNAEPIDPQATTRLAVPVVTPAVATVIASYNCSAACENCCFESRPGLKQRLSLDEMKRFISEANNFATMRLIVFSGGECFLLGKDLDEAVKHAASLGLQTRCVTNSYWASTKQKALARLQTLKDAGLCELNISTGDNHQRFVSEECVINGAEAAVDLGLVTVIVVEIQRERRVTKEQLVKSARIAALLDRPDADRSFRIIESPWMPSRFERNVPQARTRLVNRTNVQLRRGCDSVLATLVATPYANKVGVCCGLSREQIPELNIRWSPGETLTQMYDRSCSDFIKIWLYVEGPERIVAWAASIDRSIDWEDRYAHRCHACLALYRDPKIVAVVKEHYAERIDDILLRYALMVQAYQNVYRRRSNDPSGRPLDSIENSVSELA